VVGELGALRGHAVERRSIEFLGGHPLVLPEAAEVAIAEVIDEEKDDVRPRLGEGGGGQQEQREQEEWHGQW
jgi:hypothetical protein